MQAKSRGNKGSKVAMAATVVVAPMLAASPAAAQRSGTPAMPMRAVAAPLQPVHLKFPTPLVVAGEFRGNTVFKDTAGTLFYIDPATGDQRIVQHAVAFKRVGVKGAAYPIEHGTVPVTLVGVDAAGHTVMSNPRGERFYLDAKTGDMVFVK